MNITLDIVRQVYEEMKLSNSRLQRQIDTINVRRSRAETAGGFVASTLADAPLAATGGLSDGSAYIDLRWISDGLKPGETTGTGTGVLAYYDAANDRWNNVHDYAAVTT